MTVGLGCTTVLLLLLLLVLSCAEALRIQRGEVIHLKDEDFDAATWDNPGTWLVMVHAPYCKFCKELEPTWKQLATDLTDHHDIYVAKIDGVAERGLLNRFKVEAFPTIYALHGFQAWKYEGNRNIDSLKEFALGGYRKLDSIPQAPNSIFGRMLGLLHRVPGALRRQYRHLRDEHGWSDLSIILAVLAIPVVTGTVSICFLDGFYSRRSRARLQGGGQVHVAPMVGAAGAEQRARHAGAAQMGEQNNNAH